jgi:hypothetical protein
MAEPCPESQEKSERFDRILSAIEGLSMQNKEFNDRLLQLEDNFYDRQRDSDPILGFSDRPVPPSLSTSGRRPHVDARFPTFTSAESDVQGEFQSIKDSVNSVKLPSDLKVSDTRQGIKLDDQGHSAVVNKCARFAETTLKLLWQIDNANNMTQEYMQQLYLIQLAQIRYLQEEHAGLIVQGQFDRDTARLFRALQRNSSGFTPESVTTLQHAATITASVRQAQPQRGNTRGRPYSRGSWRPRNNYSSFSNRDIPFRRQDTSTQNNDPSGDN